MYTDDQTSWSMQDRAAQLNAERDEGAPEVDPVDLEYADIEKVFSDAFPEIDFSFTRGVCPPALKNGCPDYYVWDIGGMAYGDMTGVQRGNFSRMIADEIKEHPDTVFVPWSSFTHRYIEGALADLFGEDAYAEGKLPPNVIILDEKEVWGDMTDTIVKRMQTLYQLRGKK
jgi:hypothetical protein